MTLPAMSFPRLLAGVDEAGRGCLAGPVTAAAVILDPENPIDGLKDSKLLTARQRQVLACRIRDKAIAYGIAEAGCAEIERLNILQATMLAMSRAVRKLHPQPELALIDGIHCPELAMPAIPVIKGDRDIAAVSAASILAKTHRDQRLCELAKRYPGYGFDRHKGYAVKAHIEALHRLGCCPEHRRNFSPVRKLSRNGQPASRYPNTMK